MSLGTKDAMQRRTVLLSRPRRRDVEVTLLYWPVPPNERRPGSKPNNKRAGSKAKVLLPNGSRISVSTDDLYPLDKEPHDAD